MEWAHEIEREGSRPCDSICRYHPQHDFLEYIPSLITAYNLM